MICIVITEQAVTAIAAQHPFNASEIIITICARCHASCQINRDRTRGRPKAHPIIRLGTADQRVSPKPARQRIIGKPAQHRVSARITNQAIRAITTIQHVIAIAASQRVSAIAAKNAIRADIAQNTVIAEIIGKITPREGIAGSNRKADSNTTHVGRSRFLKVGSRNNVTKFTRRSD